MPTLADYYRNQSTGIPIPESGYNAYEQDPFQLALQNRNAARAWGQGLDQATRDAGNRYQNLEDAAMNAGWAQYDPILAGQGGYDPTQQANILQSNLTTGGMATNDQFNRQFLTADEQAKITGNPWAPRDFALGQVEQQNALTGEGAQRQQEAAAWNQNAVMGAANDPAAQISGGFKGELEGLTASRAAGYGDIINPDQLQVRPEFYDAGAGTLDNLAAGYQSAIDPNYLSTSQEFNTNYNFTPQDEQAFVDRAGREAGLRGQAERDALERNAAAAGNTNPLALAAAQSRNRVQSSIAASDAINNARIGARELGLNTTAGKEQMRLGAEQYLSGAASNAYSDLAGKELAQLNTGEQMRIGANQGMTDRAMNAWQDTSNVANDNAKMYEMLRLDNANTAANRKLQAADIAGKVNVATAQNVANQQQQTGQWGANMLTGLTSQAESDASQRAGEIAGNRQNVGQSNMDTRFQQGYTAGDAMSNRYTGIYGQQKDEEKEGRAWLGGQQDAAQQGALTSTDQRLSAGGTQLSGINAPTNAAISAKYIPGALEKGVGFGLSALDAYNNWGK